MKNFFTVFIKEIIDSLRDRRTLITSVLMPILLMPAILIGSIKFQEAQIKKSEEKLALVAVENSQAFPTLVSFLEKQPKITITEVQDYAKALDSGEINIYLRPESDFEKLIKEKKSADIRVVQKSSNLELQTDNAKVLTILQIFNQTIAYQRLQALGQDPKILTAINPVSVDIATAEERGGFFLGLLLPMFIVLFAIVGGMYIAIDVSAGEKERKTLEALILTPVSRLKIVTGKFLAVAVAASTSIILSLVSLYAAFKFFPPNFGTTEVVINLTPGSIGVMLGIGIILAIMFSGLLLSVAIFAKSYKEAQNYITPFYLLAVLPVAIFAQIPGFKPGLGMFLIPGVNAVFVFKEVLIKVFNPAHILITLVSLLIYSAIAIFVASRIYSKEGILFRD